MPGSSSAKTRFALLPGHDESSSFRGDAKHRTRNLEIPRCAIAHLRSGPEPVMAAQSADPLGPSRLTTPGLASQNCLKRPRHCGRCIVAGFGLYSDLIPKKFEE